MNHSIIRFFVAIIILLMCIILPPNEMFAQNIVKPDVEAFNRMVNMQSTQTGLRFKTVWLGKTEHKECPEFASFVYSTTNSLTFFTPAFETKLLRQSADHQGPPTFLASKAECRYSFTVSKFVAHNKKYERLNETHNPNVDEDLLKIEERIIKKSKNTLVQKIEPNVFLSEKQAGLFQGPTLSANGKVVIVDSLIDPLRMGFVSSGVRFDEIRNRNKFSGMLYCTNVSCSIYLFGVSNFNIVTSVDVDHLGQTFVVNGSDIRIMIDIKKQIRNGDWTYVAF